MPVPTTREEFKEYCFRALGSPVVQVNVSTEQAEDRIDEAIYVYQQSHMDAVVKQYYKHQITASVFTLNPVSGTFTVNEQIEGATSGAKGIVTEHPSANTLNFYTTHGTFANGEVITGVQSQATGTIANTVLGDMDNRYFAVPDAIIAVAKIIGPFDYGRWGGDILFDPQAQFNMSLMANFTSTSLVPYVMGRQYQQLINDTLRGRPTVRFQRHQNRLYVDVDWTRTFYPGHYIIVECFQTLDPNEYADVWTDRWLQRYCIALTKRQWATNLSKYSGIALPGGVTLDGARMLVEANQEVKELEEELKSTYQLPIDMVIG